MTAGSCITNAVSERYITNLQKEIPIINMGIIESNIPRERLKDPEDKMTQEDIYKMKVAKLKKELNKRELDTSGMKKELQQRLLQEANNIKDMTRSGTRQYNKIADRFVKNIKELQLKNSFPLFIIVGFQCEVNSPKFKDGNRKEIPWVEPVGNKHSIVFCVDIVDDRQQLEIFDSNGSYNRSDYYFDDFIMQLSYMIARELKIPKVVCVRDKILQASSSDNEHVRGISLHHFVSGGGNCDALSILYIYLKWKFRDLNIINNYFADYEGDDNDHPENEKKQKNLSTDLNKLINAQDDLDSLIPQDFLNSLIDQ